VSSSSASAGGHQSGDDKGNQQPIHAAVLILSIFASCRFSARCACQRS
jgi:hypothetical protein